MSEDRKTIFLSIPLFLAWTEQEKTELRFFEESIELLLAYCTKHNKLPPAKGEQVSKFAQKQKTAWKGKTLPEDRKTLLLSIPLFLAWTEDKE